MTNADAACTRASAGFVQASWVRERAKSHGDVDVCNYFENYESSGTDASINPGIYSLDDLKELGRARNWCPNFLTRHVINLANVIVYNYQYLLDPKIASMVSGEIERDSIVVFDEAHNIDNVRAA